MAVKVSPVSIHDQECYPLHEEDDEPEIPPHREYVTYAYNALRGRFPGWFITSNVCIYWEPGNTSAYRAPDLFVVKQPLMEPVERVYLLWKQPGIEFVLEIGSRSTFRQDEGPKVDVYQDLVRAEEYLYADPPKGYQRLWRMGPSGYETVAPQANGRLRSEQIERVFEIADGTLRIYTLDGELLLTYEETAERLAETVERVTQLEEQRQEAEQRAREAEERAATEARQRADLERQLAELRAQLGKPDDACGSIVRPVA